MLWPICDVDDMIDLGIMELTSGRMFAIMEIIGGFLDGSAGVDELSWVIS